MILLLMLVALAISALFSGSETAFFSIDRTERSRLRKEDSTPARLILTLLERPRELLVAILFGNVLVNVLYFSMAAALAADVRAGEWALLEPAVHVGSLGIIIIFGEILPKTMTITAPVLIARLVAPPLGVWQRASRLVTEPLGWLTGRCLALFERRWPAPGALTHDELAQVVALQSEEGVLSRSAGSLLEDVLLLSQVRAREIMTPRVDIQCFDLNEGREAFLAWVSEVRLAKIPVHRGDGLDGIIGTLSVKRVLREPGRPLSELVERAWFLPETKSAEEILQEILARDARIAIIVDEYGGTAGLVTVEDVVEEVVGDLSSQREVPAIQRRGPGRFDVSGALTMRELKDLLDIAIDDEGVTTVGGFVARRLGRLPKEGDEVELEELRLRVKRVEKMRTRQLEVELLGRGAER